MRNSLHDKEKVEQAGKGSGDEKHLEAIDIDRAAVSVSPIID
jgi:hypothetical protein